MCAAAQSESESGSQMAVIEDAVAGGMLKDLGFYCLNEAGECVHTGMLGKVQMSWSRGSKNVILEEGVVCLPDMAVSVLWPADHLSV